MLDAIKKALAYLQLAREIALMVIDFVKAVEIPGNGAEKLATVIELVKAAWEEVVPAEIKKVLGLEQIEKFVKVVVEIVVKFLNLTKVFTKT